MRCLLIHQAFVGPDESGGTRHYEFALYLKQHGHSLTIIAGDTNYLTGERLTDAKRLITQQDFDGVRVLRAWTYAALHRSFVHRLIAFFSFMLTSVFVALRTDRADIVLGTSPPLFQALSAWCIARIWRSTFVLEIRDLWPEFAVDMGVLQNPIAIKLSRWLENFLYSRADHMIVNSPAYKDYMEGKGVPASKITLIPNGVDPAMFSVDADGKAMRQTLGLGEKFVVTYAGALGVANDIDTLLHSTKQLEDEPNICILLVGDGKERLRLQQLATRLGLNNVIFAGARPKAEMPQILSASDAGVAILKNIPMFRTTYPNKVFDYMAAARPTILVIDGVIRDVIEAANGGIFVPPGDAAALARAIRELAHDRERAHGMGCNARRYVEQHFNRHQQSQEFCRLMEYLARQNDNGHVS